jgi:Dolichyl-phosphate-mannose-protein mannosyltransferase
VDRNVATTQRSLESSALPPLHWTVLLLIVAAKIAAHIPCLFRYGHFRDELYFLDLARHLDWGYVDCAPLVAVYGKVALLLGGSLPALRALPLLAGAALIVLTVGLARELGGGRFAQSLAGLCALVAPIYLAIDGLMTMNAFEPLFWMGCAWLLARIVRTGDSRLWLWFGVLAGLGLQNKHSTVLFGAAVLIGLLLSPQRRELGRRWIWIGAAVAFLLFLPNIVWQVAHAFPTLEDLANVRELGKNVVLSPVDFIAQQILVMHPVAFPVWLIGLASLLGGPLRRFRVLGWTYLALLVVMIGLKAKVYYLVPIYPMLLAAGGVTVEGWLERWALTRGRRWPRAIILASIAVPGAVLAPIFLPVLSPTQFLAYQEALGFAPAKTEVAHVGPLPQYFGDQFGWPELVQEVAIIYWSLPPEERQRAGIFASNYGEAGAINHFGPALGLPSPICAHQNHWLWGPPEFDGDILIWLQWSRESLEPICCSVEQVGEHYHRWGMAEENRPIFLCRGPIVSPAEVWPELKHWN